MRVAGLCCRSFFTGLSVTNRPNVGPSYLERPAKELRMRAGRESNARSEFPAQLCDTLRDRYTCPKTCASKPA